ncbi:hypothetical protein [Nostoc sp.]|uniref:hypothetical protein n=1 Tax=Nostoc sp. TaxID=1180 RepID=UPI002FFAEC72
MTKEVDFSLNLNLVPLLWIMSVLMIPHPKLHGVKEGQKYDKLQKFAGFNYFPEDGYCYSSRFLIYFRNG